MTALAMSIAAAPIAHGSQEPPPADEITLREALVIDRVGQYGRAAVHTDAIESMIVQGSWITPKAGDSIATPDGAQHAWIAVEAGEDGTLRHEALRGGYALFTYESQQERIMLLRASGHGAVDVNGEPRAGDPYGLGFVALPVRLRQGLNEFLFHCPRGQVTAKLIAPKSPIMLWTEDVTLPDVISGQPIDLWGAVVVLNCTDQPQRQLAISAAYGDAPATVVNVPIVPPLSVRKIPFRIQGPAIDHNAEGERRLEVKLSLTDAASQDAPALDTAGITLNIVEPGQMHKRTFISDIDGSVQYYALRPAHPVAEGDPPPGIVLSLHGASVEAASQAGSYASKSWCHIVAPTNRRSFGFDWEDWGRLDAMEVLAIAQHELQCDRRRTYLTGHSMGGHGTWQIAAHYPDRFVAIGPSAGWISFWSYTGAARYDNSDPIQAMLTRATTPSDTLSLSRNYLHHGIYILHGDRDDNVPVDQARAMRQHLAGYHPDFAYYERAGAGHWWGNECVDWPAMMEFFRLRPLPGRPDANRVEFHTANPGIAAASRWAMIDAQTQPLKISSIDIVRDPVSRRFTGTTSNVARLALSLEGFEPGLPLNIELDEQKIENISWPADGNRIWLAREGDAWSVVDPPSRALKSAHRAGPFKDAFRHRMMFVYGTKGNEQENAWAFAKARYDAETFWYRGNGSIDVVADVDFDPAAEPDRSVILYGNADTNSAWAALLGESPVQVQRGAVTIGQREIAGEDLAVLFVRPRPGSESACVAAVSGTGLIGSRLTDRLPYFVSGVAFPDCIVVGAETLAMGTQGVRCAGFFGNDWSVQHGEFAWRG